MENVLDRAGFPRGTQISGGTNEAKELLLARLVAWRGQIIEGEVPGFDSDDQDDDDRELLAE